MSFIVGFPPPTILYRSKECIVCMMSETEVKSDRRLNMRTNGAIILYYLHWGHTRTTLR